MKRERESDLLRATMRALAMMPHCHALRLNAGLTILGSGKAARAIRGVEPGTPDVLVMLRNGRVLWIELKTSTGKLSDAQTAWHARARSMGHDVLVARSVQDAVDAVREAIGGKP